MLQDESKTEEKKKTKSFRIFLWYILASCGNVRAPIEEQGRADLYGFAVNPVGSVDCLGLIDSLTMTIPQMAAAGMSVADIARITGISLEVAKVAVAIAAVNKAVENFENNAKGRDPCDRAKNALSQAEKGTESMKNTTTIFELKEACVHLTDLIARMESSSEECSALSFEFGHVIEHINFAWHVRNMSDAEVQNLSQEKFNALCDAVPNFNFSMRMVDAFISNEELR